MASEILINKTLLKIYDRRDRCNRREAGIGIKRAAKYCGIIVRARAEKENKLHLFLCMIMMDKYRINILQREHKHS